MKRNRSYPATEQTQHVWRKFIIKDQKPNLYFGLLEIYWVILTSCSCLSPGPDTWLSTSTYGEYFLNAVVSVECIFYLGSLNILSAANPHLFAFLVHSYHCFKGSCASKVTACLRCCLCPHATPSECRDRGLPAAATHMAIQTWGAKTRCLLTDMHRHVGMGLSMIGSLTCMVTHHTYQLILWYCCLLFLFCSLLSQMSHFLLVYFYLFSQTGIIQDKHTTFAAQISVHSLLDR